MKITFTILIFLAIDMVDDLTRFRASYFSMLINLAVFVWLARSCISLLFLCCIPGSALNCSIGNLSSYVHQSGGRNNFVSAKNMASWFTVALTVLVTVKRVSVPSQHLVVTRAQIAGFNWPFAVKARTAWYSIAPTIRGCAVLAKPFVVHQAKTGSRMFSVAGFNLTSSHRCIISQNRQESQARYRMLGNAVCVPTAEWIARRITQQEAA